MLKKNYVVSVLGLLGLGLASGCTPLGALGVGVTLALTPGSTHPIQPGEPYPSMGDAVEHNMAVQIADPAPAAAADTDLPMDGSRGLTAIERYKTNKVFPPERISTTSGGN